MCLWVEVHRGAIFGESFSDTPAIYETKMLLSLLFSLHLVLQFDLLVFLLIL